jgi:DNA-binding winged helix-turn-helix (wHTH) protein
MLTYNKIKVDTDCCRVTYDGKSICLHPQEYRLLLLFLQNPNHVLTYDRIIDCLWQDLEIPANSTIRSHVKNIRKAFKKLEGDFKIIETVHGIGYRLKPVKQIDYNEDKINNFIYPSLSVVEKLLKAKAIEYLVVDKNLLVKSISPRVLIYSDYPNKLKIGSPAVEAFPEFIGLEGVFEKVLNQEEPYFEIKGIARACNPYRPAYINFYGIADTENTEKPEETLLFIFFESGESGVV